MKQAIMQAIENFCSTILYVPLENGKSIGKQFYGAAIALIENDIEHIWYLFFKKDTLNIIAQNLLCEDHLCEDDLDDLLKEISNQIIGSAKVILETTYPHCKYQLSVPEFMGNVPTPFPIKLQESLVYKIKNRTFVIGR
ncbi:MAG: chemotaxis protein CheX [Sulfurospirillaceae bacterium]|nr:chemotaxis protein CheX [Sulfurospirillaceae bacterium]MDD2827755.1 chemotaxis protein CheX [Sulfurospirillaceae bacterium]